MPHARGFACCRCHSGAHCSNWTEQPKCEFGLFDLFITYTLGLVEYIAEQVAVMQIGRIVKQCSSASVLGAPQQGYPRTLLAAVPRL